MAKIKENHVVSGKRDMSLQDTKFRGFLWVFGGFQGCTTRGILFAMFLMWGLKTVDPKASKWEGNYSGAINFQRFAQIFRYGGCMKRMNMFLSVEKDGYPDDGLLSVPFDYER